MPESCLGKAAAHTIECFCTRTGTICGDTCSNGVILMIDIMKAIGLFFFAVVSLL